MQSLPSRPRITSSIDLPLSLYSPLTFWTTAVAASSNSGKDSR